eukprot:COSAG02_NODE_39540_length_416_cov_0.611987_1_plen_58_part_01
MLRNIDDKEDKRSTKLVEMEMPKDDGTEICEFMHQQAKALAVQRKMDRKAAKNSPKPA